MAHPRLTVDDFRHLYTTIGPNAMSRQTGLTLQSIHQRRRKLETQFGPIKSPNECRSRNKVPVAQHAARLHFDVLNGTVLIGSDAHLWPGPLSTAMRGFIKFSAEMKPRLLILNGDVLDFPQISRHPPIGWDEHPNVKDEIENAQRILTTLEDTVPRSTKLVWSLGNHCARFETRLAMVAKEYAKLNGFHLKDYFPKWAACWSAWINPDSDVPCVVKHRFKGGIGATRANVLNAGTHMVTGHLHSANVRGLNDYRKQTRWGVDTGCLADPSAEAFVDYTEDGPLDWRSGFGVFTFKDGVLLQPELALVYDKKHIQFRGQLISV